MLDRLGRARTLSALILGAWALYISVVVASNLSDLLASFGLEHWAFRSGNLAYIAKTTQIYFHSGALNEALLAGVIVWEGLSAGLLWRAAIRSARTGVAMMQARSGLLVLGLLWFAFAISTELFVAYDRGVDETAYWTLAVAVLATLAVLELMGDRSLPEQVSTPTTASEEPLGRH